MSALELEDYERAKKAYQSTVALGHVYAGVPIV